MFERIERPLSEILLWLESKRLFITKIVPPSNCFTATSSSAKPDNKGVRSKTEEEVEVEKMKEEEERMEKEMRGEEEETKEEEERKEGDIHSVSHLLNLIDRTRTTTEDIITERESEISRQSTLRTMLLQQSALDADLRAVTDMQNNAHQTVCIMLHVTLLFHALDLRYFTFHFFTLHSLVILSSSPSCNITSYIDYQVPFVSNLFNYNHFPLYPFSLSPCPFSAALKHRIGITVLAV